MPKRGMHQFVNAHLLELLRELVYERDNFVHQGYFGLRHLVCGRDKGLGKLISGNHVYVAVFTHLQYIL